MTQKGGVTYRIDQLQDDVSEILRRLGALEATAQDAKERMSDLYAEVGRVPPLATRGTRKSVSDRLHNIESQVSATAIEAAVTRALNQRRGALWSRWQRFVTVGGVVIGAVAAVARLFGVGG